MDRGLLALALVLACGFGLGGCANQAATGDPESSEVPNPRPTPAEPVVFVEAPTDPNATQATRARDEPDAPAPKPAVGPAGPGPEVDEADLREAKRLYGEGLTRFEQGDYAVALPMFRQAHALVGKPELLFNVARCLERLGRVEEACDTYLELRDQAGARLGEVTSEAMAQLGC